MHQAHLIAVFILKSIVAELSSLNLYIEDHVITRITFQGRRPRDYTNVTVNHHGRPTCTFFIELIVRK